MIKLGVSVKGIQPEMVLAYFIVSHIFEKEGFSSVITDGMREGGLKSLHPFGYALDFRTSMIPDSQRSNVAERVNRALGTEYDVVLEADHLHVEFDPRKE